MGLQLGLGVNKLSSLGGGGGGGPEPELVSHWIAENPTLTVPVPNQVSGKPTLTPIITENIDWLPYQGWANNTGGQSPTLATGNINDTVSNYTFMMAHQVGSGFNASINQRFMGGKDIGDVEIIDLVSFPKLDNTRCFWNVVTGQSQPDLPIAAIGSTTTQYIFTFVFEDPDIKIYRNGVLQGTLADSFSQGKLDGAFAFGQYYGGGTNGYLACSWAEIKIWAGVLSSGSQASEESAMATTWGITL